eukprot:2390879-Pleurochrysis_carterae.AAC.4
MSRRRTDALRRRHRQDRCRITYLLPKAHRFLSQLRRARADQSNSRTRPWRVHTHLGWLRVRAGARAAANARACRFACACVAARVRACACSCCAKGAVSASCHGFAASANDAASRSSACERSGRGQPPRAAARGSSSSVRGSGARRAERKDWASGRDRRKVEYSKAWIGVAAGARARTDRISQSQPTKSIHEREGEGGGECE